MLPTIRISPESRVSMESRSSLHPIHRAAPHVRSELEMGLADARVDPRVTPGPWAYSTHVPDAARLDRCAGLRSRRGEVSGMIDESAGEGRATHSRWSEAG